MSKSNRIKFILLWLSTLTLFACQTPPQHPLQTQSDYILVGKFDSFEEYRIKTIELIRKHRYFLSNSPEQEVEMNSPYEIKPTQPNGKGILLVHGLSDSPWTFIDVGHSLAKSGYLVRTILLPGHGTRPADLIDADSDDWQALVAKHVQLLSQDIEQVYLGGFSTGANLAFIHAQQDDQVQGLMLFSPGFKSDTELDAFAPIVSFFKEWIIEAEPNIDSNMAKYESMPTNGFAQYYHTSAEVLDIAYDKPFQKPVFLALTEHDSVLDTTVIMDIFNRQFTHPNSRLIWYGDKTVSKGRVISRDSRVPKYQISNMSHMSLTYSPQNPYYGEQGEFRMCQNGNGRAGYFHCTSGGDVWYSAWGYREPGKVHARSTFNPYFEDMMATALSVLSSSPVENPVMPATD